MNQKILKLDVPVKSVSRMQLADAVDHLAEDTLLQFDVTPESVR